MIDEMFNDPVNILTYLDRCCSPNRKMTIEDLQREINKVKNLVEEHRVAEFHKLFG